ncbi:MAG: sugar phosphate nucleotidyltransferase [Candidatus Bathyarchaeia archaeon]
MENCKDTPKAVILAAGRGERLLPYTEKCPKPLTLISGRPILEHVICTLKSVGIKDFVIVTGYLGNAIQTYFGDGSRLGVTIRYIENPSYPRGNATSLAVAEKLLGNNEIFLLSMADHLMDRHIVERALKNIDRQPLLCVDLKLPNFFQVKDATKVLVGSDGYIKDIGKTIPRWNGLDTGLFLLDDTIFDTVHQMVKTRNPLILSQCIGQMIKSHELWACDVSGFFWLDVDTWEDLLLARERCSL